jgi:hypothetical protein
MQMTQTVHESTLLREYARALYLFHVEQNPDVAQEYLAAIRGSEVALHNFLRKWSDTSPEIAAQEHKQMIDLAVEIGLIPPPPAPASAPTQEEFEAWVREQIGAILLDEAATQ